MAFTKTDLKSQFTDFFKAIGFTMKSNALFRHKRDFTLNINEKITIKYSFLGRNMQIALFKENAPYKIDTLIDELEASHKAMEGSAVEMLNELLINLTNSLKQQLHLESLKQLPLSLNEMLFQQMTELQKVNAQLFPQPKAEAPPPGGEPPGGGCNPPPPPPEPEVPPPPPPEQTPPEAPEEPPEENPNDDPNQNVNQNPQEGDGGNQGDKPEDEGENTDENTDENEEEEKEQEEENEEGGDEGGKEGGDEGEKGEPEEPEEPKGGEEEPEGGEEEPEGGEGKTGTELTDKELKKILEKRKKWRES
jgi:hypothetical protein